MKRHWLKLIALLALFLGAPRALAQPAVFFDDFNGDALLPHWVQPPSYWWEHNVSNGMLNVTGLFNPSSSQSEYNYATMAAGFAQQSDFRMDVWMGWDAGDQPHRLAIHVGGPFGGSPIIASFGYRHEFASGPNPLIFASASNQGLTMPAPAPGIHQFTISRTGTQFNFLLNGNPFASFTDNFGTPAAAVLFEFVGPYPGTLGAFHIDRVQVVPAPGAMLLLLPLALGSARRRSC